MTLHDTEWLAKKLGISVSTIEKLRSQQSEDLPASITIGKTIRYSEAYVEWWLQKKLNTNIPTYSQWLKEYYTQQNNNQKVNNHEITN